MPPSRQLDLLNDWVPPATTVRFEDSRVRASGLAAQLSRVVAAALTDAKQSREAIAKAMSAFLGETISVNMLNAYASQAREGHSITLPRFIALVHATGDRRLLEWMAEPMRWSVIDTKHLPLIELAALNERRRELDAAADSLRRQARAKGGL
jgi:hypothetical protein